MIDCDIPTAVLTVGLTQNSFGVDEDVGQFQICASIESGQIEREIALPLTLQLGTASTGDFDLSIQTFTFSDLTATSCLGVEVFDDGDVFDDDKTFSVTLNCNSVVRCGSVSTVEATISNIDGKEIYRIPKVLSAHFPSLFCVLQLSFSSFSLHYFSPSLHAFLFFTYVFLSMSSSSEIEFAFAEQGRYTFSENTTSSEVCIEVVRGTLGRDVSFSLNTANDSDPRTLNGTTVASVLHNMSSPSLSWILFLSMHGNRETFAVA